MDGLIGQAVKLKEAQVRNERQRWLALPRVVRESVYACLPASAAATGAPANGGRPAAPAMRFVGRDCAAAALDGAARARLQSSSVALSPDFAACLAAADACVSRAKALQASGAAAEARTEFGGAVAVFCFALCTKPAWDTKGFADEDLVFATLAPAEDARCAALSREQLQQATALVAKALCGLAICAFKLGELADCEEHCLFALRDHIDPASLLAAFWYARAATEARTSGAVQTDRAIAALRRALASASAPGGGPAAPAARQQQRDEVARLLLRLEAEKRDNDARGRRMFATMFSRGGNGDGHGGDDDDDDDDDPSRRRDCAAGSAPAPAKAAAVDDSEYVEAWRSLETQQRCDESPDGVAPRTLQVAQELVAAAAAALATSLSTMRAGLTSLVALTGGAGQRLTSALPTMVAQRLRDLGFRPDLVGTAAAAAPVPPPRELLDPRSGAREELLRRAVDARLAEAWVAEALELDAGEAHAEAAAIDGRFSAECASSPRNALKLRRRRLLRLS